MLETIKLLLIEDDVVDQLAFRRLVKEQRLPYEYTIAGSIAEARKLLAANRFDVIVADYKLGDGSSFDLFDAFAGTPTVFTTGIGHEEIAVKALKLGAVDY